MDIDYILFFTKIRLFNEYIKMQFFLNYLFKIYKFLYFTIVFNTFFISKLYFECTFRIYIC